MKLPKFLSFLKSPFDVYEQYFHGEKLSRDTYLINICLLLSVGAFVHGFLLTQSLQLMNQDLYIHSLLSPTNAAQGVNFIDTTEFIVHNISVLYLGEIVGVFLSSPLCDTLGRCFSLFLSSIVTLICLIFYIIGSSTIPGLYSLKFVIGIPLGMQFHAALVYIAEISTFTQRGQLLSCITMALCLGSFFGYFFQTIINWCILTSNDTYANGWWFSIGWKVAAFFIPGCALILQIWTLMFIPETPRWLLANRTPTDCSTALKHYRRTTDVKKEFTEMYRALSSDARLGDSWLELIVSKSIKLRVVLGFILPFVSSVALGIGGLCIFFAEELLMSIGFTSKLALNGSVLVMWILACVASYHSMNIVDGASLSPTASTSADDNNVPYSAYHRMCECVHNSVVFCGKTLSSSAGAGGRRKQLLSGAMYLCLGWVCMYTAISSDAWVLSKWIAYQTSKDDNTFIPSPSTNFSYSNNDNSSDFIVGGLDMLPLNASVGHRFLSKALDVSVVKNKIPVASVSLFLSTSLNRFVFLVGFYIAVYYFFYSIGNIQWVYIAEIYPYRARAKLVSCSMAGYLLGMLWSAHVWKYGLLAGLITYRAHSHYPKHVHRFYSFCAQGWLMSRPLFLAIAVCSVAMCCLWWLIVYAYYPETKRLMLEDMEVLFRVENNAFMFGCCPISHSFYSSMYSHSQTTHDNIGNANSPDQSLVARISNRISSCFSKTSDESQHNSVHVPSPPSRVSRRMSSDSNAVVDDEGNEEDESGYWVRIKRCWSRIFPNGYQIVGNSSNGESVGNSANKRSHVENTAETGNNVLFPTHLFDSHSLNSSAVGTSSGYGGSFCPQAFVQWWTGITSGWLGQRSVQAHVFARANPFPISHHHQRNNNSAVHSSSNLHLYGQGTSTNNNNTNHAQPNTAVSVISSFFSPPYFPTGQSLFALDKNGGTSAHVTPAKARSTVTQGNYGSIEMLATPSHPTVGMHVKSSADEEYGFDDVNVDDDELIIFEPSRLHKYSREMQETKFHHVRILPPVTPNNTGKQSTLTNAPATPATVHKVSYFTSPPGLINTIDRTILPDSNNYSQYFNEKHAGSLFDDEDMVSNPAISNKWRQWQDSQEEEDEEFFGDGNYGDPEVHDFVSSTRYK